MNDENNLLQRKWERTCPGLYYCTDNRGREWVLEHVTKSEGFARNEWHLGTEADPHANQYNTMREAREALKHFLNK